MSVINHNNHVTIKARLFILEVAVMVGGQLQQNKCYNLYYGFHIEMVILWVKHLAILKSVYKKRQGKYITSDHCPMLTFSFLVALGCIS